MRKILLLLLVCLIFAVNDILAQDEYPGGSPIGRIFADYRYSVDNNNDFNGFGVSRAWLGYNYNLDENFSAQVMVDIGAPLNTNNVSIKRYALLRNASIAYMKDGLTLSFGMIDARAAKSELKLWGKRYLARPFLLNYKFANVADLGFIADYVVSDIVKIDASVLNGEGYGKIEADNSLLYALGVTFTPVEGLHIRAYADTYKRDDATKNTLSGTIGYQHEKFTLAAGYNYKTDFDWTDEHNTGGFTIFGGYNISPRLELFGRYDNISSVVISGETESWNYDNDGSFVIAGLQYKVMKQLKFALNYQGWSPDNSTVDRWDFIQLNAEFRF